MNKKETLIPFAFVALSLIFVAVSAMVYLSGGKSKKWVARKMRIGGLLLTLSVFSCNNTGSQNIEVKCYKATEINSIQLKNNQSMVLNLNRDSSNILEGSITSIQGNEFSFAVSDSLGTTFQKGNLKFDDKIDSNVENFKIEIDEKLKSGKYLLKIYVTNPENQSITEQRREYKLFIKK